MSESRGKKIRTEENHSSTDDAVTPTCSDRENDLNCNAPVTKPIPSVQNIDFDTMTRDTAREIIKYLGPTDKINFCYISSRYRLFFDDPTAWRARFIRHFPHLIYKYDMTAPLDFRQLFIDAELRDYNGLDIKFIRALRAIKEGSSKVNDLDLSEHELSTHDNSGISIIMWASLKRIQPVLNTYHQHTIEGLISSRSPHAQIVRAQTLLESILLCRQGTEALTTAIEAAPPVAIATIMNERGYQLLQLAAQIGDRESVEILLAYRCNPNTQDSNGYSALLHAAKYGHAPVVKLLLDAGAHPNAKDKNDLIPLINALLFANFACAKLITDAGGNPNAVTYSEENETDDDLDPAAMDTEEEPAPVGIPVLTTATMCGRADMVARLIELGADINCVNPMYNDPPLYYAVLSGHVECVKVLLKANACTDFRTMTTKANFTSYLSKAPAEVQARIPAFLTQFPEDNFSVSIEEIATTLGYEEIAERLDKHRKDRELAGRGTRYQY